jgi:hypothetical protein
MNKKIREPKGEKKGKKLSNKRRIDEGDSICDCRSESVIAIPLPKRKKRERYIIASQKEWE